MEYFNSLPEDITMEVLIRVPTETVLKCKLVCRNWRNLIRRPSFSKRHTKHHLNHAGDSGKLGFIVLTASDWIWKNYNFQYFEYNENHESTTRIWKNYNFQYFEYNENHESTTPPVDRVRRINFNPPFGEDTIFLASCNGLLCLARFGYTPQQTYICNPITREFIMLPETKRVSMDHGASGFGYVSSTNEYKVVRMICETQIMEVYIYTLGSGLGWRNLGEFNFGSYVYSHEGIFVNGTLYWLDYALQRIIHFDLAEEKFCGHLPYPLQINEDFEEWYYELGVLDGCLSFANYSADVYGTEYWDVWLLRKKQCMKDPEEHRSLGWSEKFRVYDKDLFAVTKGHAVLTYNGNHINIHDLKASTSKRIVDLKEHVDVVVLHKNTLLSLKELGEEDIKIMEPVEIEETETLNQLFNQLLEDENLDTNL